jgi:Zn-dependent protease with chaperone function
MIAPYLLRLLCLCLASFFLLNFLLGLAASIASRAAVRIAETMRPRTATGLLFTLRLLPATLAVGMVLGLCIPSYLWFEPQAAPERVGLACLTLAFLGALGGSLSLARTAHAVVVSLRCRRTWREAGYEASLPGEPSRVVVVEKDTPLLALAGVLRPRLIISGAVLRALSREQLALAFDHENAHRGSQDNLKRLLLLLAPDSIPFVTGFSMLDRAWARFSEWAADDEAARGDSHRAVCLAAALLCVARMGAIPRLSVLHTALVPGDHDLSARIDRLLRSELTRSRAFPEARPLVGGAALLSAGSLLTLLFWPATLSSAHRLLELFLR